MAVRIKEMFCPFL